MEDLDLSCAEVNAIVTLDQIEISVFPNPVSEMIFLEYPSDFLLAIELYNNAGQLLDAQRNVNFINVDHLSNGVYFLKLTALENGKTKTERVVVSR